MRKYLIALLIGLLMVLCFDYVLVRMALHQYQQGPYGVQVAWHDQNTATMSVITPLGERWDSAPQQLCNRGISL